MLDFKQKYKINISQWHQAIFQRTAMPTQHDEGIFIKKTADNMLFLSKLTV